MDAFHYVEVTTKLTYGFSGDGTSSKRCREMPLALRTIWKNSNNNYGSEVRKFNIISKLVNLSELTDSSTAG